MTASSIIAPCPNPEYYMMRIMAELSSELDRPMVPHEVDAAVGDDVLRSLDLPAGSGALDDGNILRSTARSDGGFGDVVVTEVDGLDAGAEDEIDFDDQDTDRAVTAARALVDRAATDNGEEKVAAHDDVDDKVEVGKPSEKNSTDIDEPDAGQNPPGDRLPPNGGGGEHGDDASEGDDNPRPYRASEVARFLTNDRVALRGVSPEVGAQNRQLVEKMRQTAEEVGDDVMAVQFIGSRANGTSGLDSDLDAAIITLGGFDREEVRDPMRDTARVMGVTLDCDLAVRAAGIADEVPEDPEEFMHWVEHGVEGRAAPPIALFNDGVYRTDNLLLARLAAVEIIRSYPYSNQVEEAWQHVREQHDAEYLGNLDRMRERLTSRLGAEHADEVRRALSQQMMQERHTRFGLPADIVQYHQRLARWETRNQAQLSESRGFQLLQAVRNTL